MSPVGRCILFYWPRNSRRWNGFLVRCRGLSVQEGDGQLCPASGMGCQRKPNSGPEWVLGLGIATLLILGLWFQ